jgi:hypothetical protein
VFQNTESRFFEITHLKTGYISPSAVLARPHPFIRDTRALQAKTSAGFVL